MQTTSLFCYTHSVKKIIFFVLLIVGILGANQVNAQEIHQDLQGVWRAKVVEIVSTKEESVPGTQLKATVQYIRAQILEGERAGERVLVKNDYLKLKEGDKFYMNYLITVEGVEMFSVRDVDRRATLAILVGLFAFVVILFSGKQGVRSLLSLMGSFLMIIFVLLPLLLRGYAPIPTSILVGALVLFCAIYFTHGFNFSSTIAFAGTTSAVVLTGILAYVAVHASRLSGFYSDETVYLNLNTHGTLNFEGLLLGGIIIGVLGVLDDIAVTQVAVVSELKHLNKDLTFKEIYFKALRVGREHVSALVNTLVLAYAGVSLPLMLWVSQSNSSFSTIINDEIFATEIVRTLVGSIGLILTVPITTFLAVYFAHRLKHTHIHSHGH